LAVLLQNKTGIDFKGFVRDWIKPFGTIFINLLKLIAIPLIVASLIKGISDLKDISQLSRMGGRTIGIYVFTTFIAVILGLGIVNLIKPGTTINDTTRTQLEEGYGSQAIDKITLAESTKGSRGPLQPLIDLVPDNIFNSMTDNKNMLSVIFFVILFGIGMVLAGEKQVRHMKGFIDGLNEVVMRIIDMIMLYAPYGVFALLAALVVESPSIDLFKALMWYSFCIVLGLASLIFLFYPLMLRIFVGINLGKFFRGIAPAQLVAFSTSSSAATLPVTMERVSEHLGVDEEVTSFVLPIGATVNMDGTALYQGVAAVFIAQAFGIDLDLMGQLSIVALAVLASIGSAAVPSAGIIMLVVVLETINVPPAGIALILAIDRPLDMLRTVANITGDATVAMIVGKSLGKINVPHARELGDHYPEK
jgi:Na+/H+-dicarboxylate symporter